MNKIDIAKHMEKFPGLFPKTIKENLRIVAIALIAQHHQLLEQSFVPYYFTLLYSNPIAIHKI